MYISTILNAVANISAHVQPLHFLTPTNLAMHECLRLVPGPTYIVRSIYARQLHALNNLSSLELWPDPASTLQEERGVW